MKNADPHLFSTAKYLDWHCFNRLHITVLWQLVIAMLFWSALSCTAATLYYLTFDHLTNGAGPGPDYAKGSGEILPLRPDGTPLRFVRIDGNAAAPVLPQIATSTGPQGGRALQTARPSDGRDSGYLAPRSGLQPAPTPSLINNPPAFTLEALVKIDSFNPSQSSGIAGLVTQWGTGGIQPSLQLQSGTSNNPLLAFTLSGHSKSVALTNAPAASLVDGHWHHVAGAYTADSGDGLNSRIELFLDGRSVASLLYTKPVGNQTLVPYGFSFGFYSYQDPVLNTNGFWYATGGGRVLNGQLDAAAVSTDLLTPATFLLPQPQPLIPLTRIEKRAADYSATEYLNATQLEDIQTSGYLKYAGTASYTFDVPQSGWYEFYVAAATWSTDLYLDGQFLLRTAFDSGLWPKQNDAYKVLNLSLASGTHTLKFDHTWPSGLPWMTRFWIVNTPGLAAQTRLTLDRDALVLRKDEPFTATLVAGRQSVSTNIYIKVSAATNAAAVVVQSQLFTVAAGSGNQTNGVTLSTAQDGTFTVNVVDDAGNPLDRSVQYVVVATNRPSAPATLSKTLVQTIDCVATPPDYSSGDSRTVSAALGSYRESGPLGRMQNLDNASFFAYTLAIPALQQPCLLEIEYPDNDERTAVISLLETNVASYSIGAGYVTGGPYRPTGLMQTNEIWFWPRESNPRVHLLSWRSGQRAAASKIRLYQVTSGLPALLSGSGSRRFGAWSEEALRWPVAFGGMPEGNTWSALRTPLERWAQWSRYTGANLWLQTVSIYQTALWPSRTIPGLGMDDESSISQAAAGPLSLRDPVGKDILRLMLLTGEKYGIGVVGELDTSNTEVIDKYLDRRFGGDGDLSDDGPDKSWLTVSKEGKTSSSANPFIHFNPLYPGVQDWVAETVQELASRYCDSPAFLGVSLRLMDWNNAAWQILPSIRWGYDDDSVGRFTQQTGIAVPGTAGETNRFSQRYTWLMANAYQPWVDWRCQQIHAYYQRLADILTAARPDLKLFLDAHGPEYASEATTAERDSKGWLGLAKESGLDPSRYTHAANIVLSDLRSYPAGIRAATSVAAAAEWDHAHDPVSVAASAKPGGSGDTHAVRFGYEYMEASIDGNPLGVTDTLRSDNDYFISGCLNPSGRHALARYAAALADGNITFMSDGGNVYTLGQSAFLREFMAEYQALPSIGMSRFTGDSDPVALWSGTRDGTLFFYLVNRSDADVPATVTFSGSPVVTRLGSGQAATLSGGVLTQALAPYQLLAFSCSGGGIAGFAASSTGGTVSNLQAQLDSAASVLGLNGGGPASVRRVVALSPAALAAAQTALTAAQSAFAAGNAWQALTLLLSHPLVAAYEAFGSYPDGLFARALPTPPAPTPAPRAGHPTLTFQKMIGDMRGVGMQNLSVAVTDNGEIYLLQLTGRVPVFTAAGAYLESLSATLPSPATYSCLVSASNLVLLADYRTDYPWLYDALRQGSGDGQFLNPRAAVTDAAGTVYVADSDNRRVQAFATTNNAAPVWTLSLSAKPIAAAARCGLLAVITDDRVLRVYDTATHAAAATAYTLDVGPSCVAIGPDRALFVGYNSGPNRYWLKRYALVGEAVQVSATVAPSYSDQLPNFLTGSVPLTTGPDGKVWLADQFNYKIVALDPATDTATTRLSPAFRPICVGFNAAGNAFVGGYTQSGGSTGPVVSVFSPAGVYQTNRPPAGALYGNTSVPVWGLLPCGDGSVLTRVVVPGYQQDWPAFNLKKLFADGSAQPFHDFGYLYAVRATFNPAAMCYALGFDSGGNIILASLPNVAVSKLSASGTLLWEASSQPSGGADAVAFSQPRDTALDRHGNIWVVDSGTHAIYCLSSAGKLLLQFGGYGNVDVVDGSGFDRPSGIAIVRFNDCDYLYVGDAGNQRLVKYRISYGAEFSLLIN